MLRSLMLAVAALVVTATVTPAQPAGKFQVVITNMATGTQHPWTKRSFPDQNRCDAALGNLNVALRALAGDGDVPDAYSGNDPELIDDVQALVIRIVQNTGKVPNFSISCELAGDPA